MIAKGQATQVEVEDGWMSDREALVTCGARNKTLVNAVDARDRALATNQKD